MYVCLPVCIHLCCSMENKGCVALNLSKIEDMQTRLQSNLEAIGMLNQQVSARPHARTQTHTRTRTHRVLTVLLPDRYKHTPTHRPTCCWAHTEEEAFMRPTSNTQAHLHRGARRHPFPLPTIKVKNRQRGGVRDVGTWCGEVGCVCVRGGGTNRIGKRQWRSFPLVNDFPFMKLRERCISIQPCWSLHDSIGKWPAVIKQCGGKNTEEYSWEMLTFFTVLSFTRVNKSPKKRQIKSTPQPPQFSKTPGPRERLTRLLLVCEVACWLTGYDKSWYLLKF